MTYNNLSDAEKRRFKQNNICPICGKEFQLWKLANGNYTHAKYCKND